jgi:hypothetical protein
MTTDSDTHIKDALFWRRCAYLYFVFEESEDFRMAATHVAGKLGLCIIGKLDALEPLNSWLHHALKLAGVKHGSFGYPLFYVARATGLVISSRSDLDLETRKAWDAVAKEFIEEDDEDKKGKPEPNLPAMPLPSPGESWPKYRRRIEGIALEIFESSARTDLPKLSRVSMQWTWEHATYAELAERDGIGEDTVQDSIQKLLKQLGISRGRGRPPGTKKPRRV